MLQAKADYKSNYEKLRKLKMECESITALEKQNLKQLENDFHRWILLIQKERESATSGMDSTMLSSNIKDQEVKKHLEDRKGVV